MTPSRPRNPLLADAFKRPGLVERTARGIDTIFFEQLRNGRPVPSYERSTEASVVLFLPGGKASLEFVHLVSEEGQAGRLLGLDELLILNALWQERRLTTGAASALIQKPEREAAAVVERLVETGLVESRGSSRGRSYHLSAAIYRQLGDEAAYVRARNFEPIQQEHMILQFVQAHGRITRSQVAQLCRISVYQATRLLNALAGAAKIARRGVGKGTWYGPHE